VDLTTHGIHRPPAPLIILAAPRRKSENIQNTKLAGAGRCLDCGFPLQRGFSARNSRSVVGKPVISTSDLPLTHSPTLLAACSLAPSVRSSSGEGAWDQALGAHRLSSQRPNRQTGAHGYIPTAPTPPPQWAAGAREVLHFSSRTFLDALIAAPGLSLTVRFRPLAVDMAVGFTVFTPPSFPFMSPFVSVQCRERWHNQLDPAIRKDPWTREEEDTLLKAHAVYGNRCVTYTRPSYIHDHHPAFNRRLTRCWLLRDALVVSSGGRRSLNFCRAARTTPSRTTGTAPSAVSAARSALSTHHHPPSLLF